MNPSAKFSFHIFPPQIDFNNNNKWTKKLPKQQPHQLRGLPLAVENCMFQLKVEKIIKELIFKQSSASKLFFKFHVHLVAKFMINDNQSFDQICLDTGN